ncbi:transposase [Streptosporangium subroseum]|uniref:Transposase n=1 Tax=Streptosporangium subroseum TaxID=106412 RepID=A0A239P0P5_9ACTN|nr:RNA-guided endonuclease TnpB family protein [Streptosporangium subroseum]SNT60562.1 transposase [Streptosporangium subroseum]
MARREVLKAFRFTLDPTRAQETELRRYAGAARWAFNHALAAKVAAHQERKQRIAALIGGGLAEEAARKQIKVSVLGKGVIQKAWVRARGSSRNGAEGICPWSHEVNNYCFQSAFDDADAAWKNWLDSITGKRVGRWVGYPRFKKKGRTRDSFRIPHNVNKPGIRLVTHRRLRIPKLGEVRLHDSARRLVRLIKCGQAVVRSVTVSRGGHRWYASVLCKVTVELPDKPTRRQAAAGTIGLDLGVTHLIALSQPADLGKGPTQLLDNPRYLRATTKRLRRAQQALSRTQKGSTRREKAKRRVARLHNQVAARRATFLHGVTKRLATGFHIVAVEDLNVAGMTRSARGTVQNPGRKVRQKAGLNRPILDASPAEIRRQLQHKTSWYSSTIAVADRWFPSSKTCSACGRQNPRLTLADRVSTCSSCGLTMNRDINAARNIAVCAVARPGVQPTGAGSDPRNVNVKAPATGAFTTMAIFQSLSAHGLSTDRANASIMSIPGVMPRARSSIPAPACAIPARSATCGLRPRACRSSCTSLTSRAAS